MNAKRKEMKQLGYDFKTTTGSVVRDMLYTGFGDNFFKSNKSGKTNA
jgi:hypothetical protein